MSQSFQLQVQLVDIFHKSIYPANLHINDGRIRQIERLREASSDLPFAMPGFVDSHVHIESSMLTPSEFAKMAVVHGTVATISDPHEIANVCGIAGVMYMLENASTVPFKFHFGAPSCVPATIFETAGATIDSLAVNELLQRDDIYYLSEMMNYPGVLFQDAEVMQKIAYAKAIGKPIDGHAPGLRGKDAATYIAAGISTDHECFTLEEAAEKLALGMKILIREGSAAKNFEALIPLMHEHYQHMMFCSDDKHPDSLALNHINALCARAVAKGIDVFKVLQAACINPVLHYKMNVGLLREGDTADFILVDNLQHFNVTGTYINGQLVATNGQSLIQVPKANTINQWNRNAVALEDVALAVNEYPQDANGSIPVIEALDGQLITNLCWLQPTIENNALVSNTNNDVLKIVVVNRYEPNAPVAKAFIKNFGLHHGALASTVAHDSHNIVAVSTTDDMLVKAINAVIATQGGIAACNNDVTHVLGLPVAGLMTNEDGYTVAEAYTQIDAFVKNNLGSTLTAPFMSLSFMALLVIPAAKLSDKGLFDGSKFAFIQ
ncbi:MAG TPA: adenine deaminase [Chitinophagaceae bacterium]|nr:adenine deaminase [Chitinophagaceae bacterium]